jgi:hypothetical protein
VIPPTIITDLTVESETLNEDENGEKEIELILSWEGTADLFEIAYRKV